MLLLRHTTTIQMTDRNPIFLIVTGAIFLGIAITDVVIQERKTGVQVVDVWGLLHGYGKLAVIMFLLILVYLIYKYGVRGFFKKK